MTEPKFWVVVPAAGVGHRFGGDQPKQYYPLNGKTVAEWTLSRLLSVSRVAGCVVAISDGDQHWAKLEINDSRIILTTGGAERSDTVYQGLLSLAELASSNDWVLVHDIARPCVRAADIEHMMDVLAEDAAGGILAAPMADTVKRVSSGNCIDTTENRSQLWAALTPQMFRYSLLRDALEQAKKKGFEPTDESSAVEQLGVSPKVIAGQRDNIKITNREDLVIAEAILQVQIQQKEDH